jgi:outer membrane lipoprotein-sorting protein
MCVSKKNSETLFFSRNLKIQSMKTLKFITFLLMLVISTAALDAASQDARVILENMDKIIFSPKDKQGNVSIILIDKEGKEKVREATMLQKGSDKKLYRYTKPESQAGIATLSLPGDVMWLYMPAFAKPKKISMLSKNQAFTGTDFSYEDMATTPYADRYIPSLLSSDKDSYLLQLVPKSTKTSYSKIIVKVNKTYGYPITMEFYNGKEKKFKDATYRYEKIGKYWNAAEVVMTDLDKNHSTKIQLKDVKFDQGLSDDLFTPEKMKL